MKIRTFILLAFSLILITCKDDNPAIPVGAGNQIIIEQTEDSVSYWDALYNGTILNLNKRTIAQYGHCWDTLPNPNLSKSKTLFNNTNTDIEFSSTLDSLQPDVNYYIRSYFILGTDTAYSSESNFTTLTIQKATVIKNAEPETELYTAILQGKITDTGGEIVNKGFYYSPNPDVSQADSLILNTSENLVFADTLKNLLPNKSYYAKAFVSNRAGTNFSSEFEFKTQTKTAELTTTMPFDILAYSCKTGGNITDDFGSEITQRGVCYSANPIPTINDSLTTNGTGIGIFVSEITNLQPNTNYYIRAYAINEKGVAYGNELSFATGKPPQISTTEITNITATSAISGGSISSIGDSEIIAQGICLSTSQNPTVENQNIIDQSNQNIFSCNLINLEINTTYYVKAYAENSSGISYGNQQIFLTKNGIPELFIDSINSITAISANLFADITDNGGFDITNRGFCWSKNQSPTINDSHIENGTGIGNFQNEITQLSPATTYYVRSYATNQQDTYYSAIESFTTPTAIPLVETVSISDISFNSITAAGSVIADYGFTVSEYGFVWSDNTEPTINDSIISIGTGLGNFTANLANLNANTTYYIRAYATNEKGTGYGKNISFSTTNFIQKCLGGSSYDAANSIQQTTDGGFIVVGGTDSNDGDVSGNHGGTDVWVTKLNSDLSINWQKTYGGSDHEIAGVIRQTSDGGYVLTGSTRSSDGDVSENKGNYDCWIVKLSSNGGIEWEKTYGGTSSDQAKDIQQTTDGAFIVTCKVASADGDVIGKTIHGDFDIWVIKLNINGDLVWQKVINNAGSDNSYSIKQTLDGGCVVTGDYNGDYYILRLDADGSLIWEKTCGGSSLDVSNSIIQLSDGGFFAVGHSQSFDGDISNHLGIMDLWLVKLSSLGSIEWEKSLGGTESDAGNEIIQVSDGNYVIAGFSASKDDDLTVNYGLADMWVVKLNLSGEIIWQKSIGGSGTDNAISITETTEGNFVVAGLSNSTTGNVLGNHGERDFWIVKLTANGELIGE